MFVLIPSTGYAQVPQKLLETSPMSRTRSLVLRFINSLTFSSCTNRQKMAPYPYTTRTGSVSDAASEPLSFAGTPSEPAAAAVVSQRAEHPGHRVISADEKTSVQARHRCHATQPPRAGMVMKVEHEYKRAGAWAYLAALDVHHARLFGRCESTTGIAPFDRLVEHVMTSSPYRDARRVFWIVDNGSSHRGARAVERLQQRYPNLALVHGPVHASWLNQIEIYFSRATRSSRRTTSIRWPR